MRSGLPVHYVGPLLQALEANVGLFLLAFWRTIHLMKDVSYNSQTQYHHRAYRIKHEQLRKGGSARARRSGKVSKSVTYGGILQSTWATSFFLLRRGQGVLQTSPRRVKHRELFAQGPTGVPCGLQDNVCSWAVHLPPQHSCCQGKLTHPAHRWQGCCRVRGSSGAVASSVQQSALRREPDQPLSKCSCQHRFQPRSARASKLQRSGWGSAMLQATLLSGCAWSSQTAMHCSAKSESICTLPRCTLVNLLLG